MTSNQTHSNHEPQTPITSREQPSQRQHQTAMASSDNDASALSLMESPFDTPSGSPAKAASSASNDRSKPPSPSASFSPKATKEESATRRLLPDEDDTIRVERFLPTPAQIFIVAQLPSVLNNKKFFQLLPDRKEGPKEGVQYLKTLCATLGLKHSGAKKQLVKRLVKYFFNHASEFEGHFFAYVNGDAWVKAKLAIQEEHKIAQALLGSSAASASGSELEDIQQTCHASLLKLVWMARKHDILPTGDVFEFLGVLYSRERALHEIDVMDTSVFMADNVTLSEGMTVIRRRTPACALRLFQIIIGNDTFYGRLQDESEAKLDRHAIDRGAHGGKSDFWTDVLAAYLDESFPIGAPMVKHSLINNPRTQKPYDLSKVSSPWVTSEKLRDWYVVAKRAFTQYKLKYDVSGEHSFSFLSDEGLKHFAENFANGAPDVIYLAGCCHRRGSGCINFFSATMPETVDKINGMAIVPALIPDSEKKMAAEQLELDYSPAAKERAKLIRQKLRKHAVDVNVSKKRQLLMAASDRDEELTKTYERMKRVLETGSASESFVSHLRKKAARLEQEIMIDEEAAAASDLPSSASDSDVSSNI